MRGINRLNEDEKARVIELLGTGLYRQKVIAEMVGISEGRVSQIKSEMSEVIPADLRERAWRESYAQNQALKRVYFEAGMAGDNVSARTFTKIDISLRELLGINAPKAIATIDLGEEKMRYVLEMDNDIAEALS